MPNNVEIKALAADWDTQFCKAEALASSREELIQEDIFFNCPTGRFKLRLQGTGEGHLIFYRRPDCSGPKTSNYDIAPVHNPDSMLKILTAALGQLCCVRKHRTVFHTGQTRIHLDEVEGLGRFIELEVVLLPDQPESDGRIIAERLMAQLGIRQEDIIDHAYAELLLTQRRSH